MLGHTYMFMYTCMYCVRIRVRYVHNHHLRTYFHVSKYQYHYQTEHQNRSICSYMHVKLFTHICACVCADTYHAREQYVFT